MQWSDSANAGFSTVAPWLPVDGRYKSYNVESEKKDENSILNYYRRLLALRHSNPELLEGDYIALNEDDTNVLSYARTYKGKSVVVVLNMSAAAQKVKLNLAARGIPEKSAKRLLASFATESTVDLHEITVAPFGAWIGELE